MNRDHYRVLGVSPGASHKDVRTAYLRLVKQHHPDVNKSCGDGSQFKAISSAWAVRYSPLICGCTVCVLVAIFFELLMNECIEPYVWCRGAHLCPE